MKRFLVLSALLISMNLSAQDNFRPGYIINQSGEKISGEINDRDWRVNPKTIQFRASGSSQAVTFGADKVSEFEVNGRLYAGRIVRLDKSHFRTEDILREKTPHPVGQDTLFFDVIVKATPSLLAATDSNDKLHLLYEKEGALTELIVKRTKVKTEEGTSANSVAVTNVFQGQLKDLFKECPSLSRKIDAAAYKTNEIKSLFNAYLSCKVAPASTVADDNPQGKLKWGLTAGLMTSSLKFDPTIAAYPENKFSSLAVPTGISFELVLPKNQGKVSIHNEIFYFGQKYNYASSKKAAFTLNYIRLNNLLRFTSPETGGARYFVNAGWGNGFAIKSEGYFSSYRKHEYALIGGVGVRKGKISGELRFETVTGFSKFADLNDVIYSGYVLIGWHF